MAKGRKERGIFFRERKNGSQIEPTSGKKGEWWIRYCDGNGRLHREKIGPKALAIAAYQKRKTEIREGKFFPEKLRKRTVLFEDMAKLYLEEYSAVNKRADWRDRSLMANLLGTFKGKTLAEITSQDVERYKGKRIQEVKPATVNRELGLLKHLYTIAIRWEKAEANPAKPVKLLKENNQRVRYLAPEEEEDLFNALPDCYKPLVKVAVHTGLRRGELLNLTWNDVDFWAGIITIQRTKAGEVRQVPMNSLVKETLSELRKTRIREAKERFPNEREILSLYVFCSPQGERFRSLNHFFPRAVRKAGIKDLVFHNLRHTFASRLAMAGVDIRTIQDLMGHKTIQMTLRYSHLSPDHKKQAVERLIPSPTDTRTDTRAFEPYALVSERWDK